MSEEKENKIYMVRHLERIDDVDYVNKETNDWKKISSAEPLYKINPYLISTPSIELIIKNLEAKDIDYIICSPFLRCIQTAILIANSSADSKHKIIYIDYRLGEIFDDYLFPTKPLDLEIIYTHSIKHISEILSSSFFRYYKKFSAYINRI